MSNKIYSITTEQEVAGLGTFTQFDIREGGKTLIKDSIDGINHSADICKQFMLKLLEKVDFYTLDRLKQEADKSNAILDIVGDMVTFSSTEFTCDFKKYDDTFYKQMY